MFPILIIAIGIAVLILGKRLAVLGAAVGAIVGVALLKLFNIPVTDLWALLIPIALAAVGFFGAAFAKGIIGIVLMVFGALAGAAIVITFLDLFNLDFGLLDWLLAVVGGVIGLVLIRRFDDWGMIILSGVIGALLVTRGLTLLMPSLEGVLGTVILIVLAGGSIFYQGGFLNRRKPEAQASASGAASPPPSQESSSTPPSTK